ncbi:MAG: thioredoxin [Thermomicrobiales bacterium]
MSNLQTVTDGTFQAEVLESTTPVLVDFWAPWCGPCRMLHPVLDEIAGERAESLKIVSVNVDENVGSAAALGVVSIPALFIFQDGKLVNKTFGAYPKRHLNDWIDESLTVVAQ